LEKACFLFPGNRPFFVWYGRTKKKGGKKERYQTYRKRVMATMKPPTYLGAMVGGGVNGATSQLLQILFRFLQGYL